MIGNEGAVSAAAQPSICLGRALIPLTLTAQEGRALRQLWREDQKNWRAAIVLGAAMGMSDAAQAREVLLATIFGPLRHFNLAHPK